MQPHHTSTTNGHGACQPRSRSRGPVGAGRRLAIFAGLLIGLSGTGWAQSFPDQVSNRATITAEGVIDPNPANNEAVDTNRLDGVADLAITKTLLTAGPYLVGQQVDYRIEVSNAGPSAASAVTIVDTPANLEIVAVEGACTGLPCTLDLLEPGATATLELATRIIAAGTFGNVAAVEAPDLIDPDPSNNEADGGGGEAQLEVLAGADVASTPQDQPVTVPVLDNDSIGGEVPGADAVVVTVIGEPANGSVSVGEDGSITYVPTQYYSGQDSFEYQVCAVADPEACATATVTVTTERNQLEVLDDEAESDQDGVTVDVLANDSSTGAPLDPSSLTVLVAPEHGQATCSDGVCSYTPAAGFDGIDRFTYEVCDLSTPETVCGSATVSVQVEQRLAQLRLVKQAGSRTVTSGDLVRYVVTATNVGEVPVRDASFVDTPAPGFTWVEGSLLVEDGDNEAMVSATSPLRIDGIDVDVGETATVTYYLRVGAGVGPGVHRNVVVGHDLRGRVISNEASAEVSFEGDPLFTDSLVVGTVFDDRDGDGWQASAGATGVRVQGGFAAGSYVPGTTTVDRGQGPQPVADASAPLLAGMELGSLPGRSSDAAPASAVEVRQVLSSPDFTGDFTLTTREGTTVRMGADGQVRVENTGDAASGRSAQDLQVRRRVAQVAEGLEVRYVVSNHGVDERGVPGVRLATVEGLLTETDAHGRYHIVGVPGGDGPRGRNFIIKVDPGTLPPGTAFTTPNPLVQRITPGIPVRFDFGAQLPGRELAAPAPGVQVELGEVLFAPDSAEVQAEHAQVIDEVAARLAEAGGGDVVIATAAGDAALALARAEAVRDALAARLDPDIREAVQVRLETEGVEQPLLTLGTVPDGLTLGTVLFEFDSATVRAEYRGLLADIAARLADAGGGVVTVTGRTDRSGPENYNQRLGLERARAVYGAIAEHLPAGMRERVRVDIDDGPDADSGAGGR